VDADANICMYREYGRMLCEALDGPTSRRPSACTAPRSLPAQLGEQLGLDPEPFIEREKHTTIKPLWDLWRSVTQDFFGTASFGIVANETYARGVRNFLENELGMPCNFAYSRAPGRQDRQRDGPRGDPRQHPADSVRQLQRAHVPGRGRQFGAVYIQASYPGTAVRRHTGTPFMGYAGATYLMQEVCNALFDALFNILPLGTSLDKVDATPARLHEELPWEADAQQALDAALENVPVLTRISAAKRLRDAAERRAREQGATSVNLAVFTEVRGAVDSDRVA
jgi:chlorophyllide a reductase subunit Z